jgi:hypothetical protein
VGSIGSCREAPYPEKVPHCTTDQDVENGLTKSFGKHVETQQESVPVCAVDSDNEEDLHPEEVRKTLFQRLNRPLFLENDPHLSSEYFTCGGCGVVSWFGGGLCAWCNWAYRQLQHQVHCSEIRKTVSGYSTEQLRESLTNLCGRYPLAKPY